MKHLCIQETLGQIPIDDDDGQAALTRAEAQALFAYVTAKGRSLRSECFQWTPNYLRISNYTGLIQLPTVAIEILPKVSNSETDADSRRALLRMLAEVGYLPTNISPHAELQLERESLFEILGHYFVELLLAEMRKGIYCNYVSEEENLKILRGKLLLRQQNENRMKGLGHKAYCCFEEFSANNSLNQLFKMTVRFLRLRIRNLATLSKLKYAMFQLDAVEDRMLTGAEIQSVQLTRLSRRFEPSLFLAKMFFQNLVATSAAGPRDAFAILFPIDLLFEKYIARVLQRHVAEQVEVQISEQSLWINRSSGYGIYRLKPDLKIGDGEGPCILLDTKWKPIHSSENRHGISREDFYQTYAYLTRYQSAHTVALIYPHHSGITEGPGICLEDYYIDGDSNKRLQIYSVRYENKFDTIDDLRKLIKTMQLSENCLKAV